MTTRRFTTSLLTRALALGLVLGATAAAAQTVYRWTDANGRTQYGSTPPPGVKASPVTTSAPPSAEAASQAQAERQRVLQRAEQMTSSRERVESQQRQKSEAEEKQATERRQRCAQARQELALFEGGGAVFGRNERNERVAVDESRRDAITARLRQAVAAYCVDGDTGQEAVSRQTQAEALARTRCNRARDVVRDLEAAGTRVPAWELDNAREQQRKACAP